MDVLAENFGKESLNFLLQKAWKILETHSDPCDIRCVADVCARHLASKDFHRVFASRLSSLLKMVERLAHVGHTGMASEHIPEGYPNSFQYFTISCAFVLLCLIGSEVNCALFDP